MERWNPKTFALFSLVVAFDNNASRGADRNPLPVRSIVREKNIQTGVLNNASMGFEMALKK